LKKPKAPLRVLLAFFIFRIFRPVSTAPDVGNVMIFHNIYLQKPFLLPLKSDFVEKLKKPSQLPARHQTCTRCRSPPLLKS